jgi:adenosylcobinamide-GDP ribazoletransferase
LLKASLLTVPTAEGAAALVLCAPVAGRALIPGCARVFRPARPDGLAATAARPPVAAIVTAALVAAAAGLLAFGAEGVAIVAIGAGAGVAACAWLARRFGGVTGDVYGAVIELTEAATLLAGSAALANGWACPFPLVHR